MGARNPLLRREAGPDRTSTSKPYFLTSTFLGFFPFPRLLPCGPQHPRFQERRGKPLREPSRHILTWERCLWLSACRESEARDGSSTFKETFADLRCWVDTSTDTKHVMLHSRAEERAGRLAVAYKVLDKIADPQDKAPNLTVADRRIALLSRLGWSHWAAHMKSRKVDVFPASLPPI